MSYAGRKLWEEMSYIFIYIYAYPSLNKCLNTQCDCVEKIIQLFLIGDFFKIN